MRIYLAVLLFLTASSLFAQSRFDGTWEMKMGTLQFFGPPESYLIDKGMYHCWSCVPQVDVRTDGTDQRVAGHDAYYDTLAVRVLNAHSVEFTFKKRGKPASRSKETVSSDGKTMMEEFTDTAEANPVIGKARFIRLSEGPSGSHALSGKWQMRTIRNDTPAGTLTTYHSIPGGLSISDGRQSYEAKFDGKDYPVSGDFPATISLRLIDDYTLEETDKRDGKIMTVVRMTVSRDGKTMRVESSDKQRGGKMTYTAEKHP
jgi:hypothetical protein